MGPRTDLDGCGKSRPTGNYFVFSYTMFVLHPYLCLCLDCPAFCLLVFTYNTQHKHSCPRRDSKPQPQHAIVRRPSPSTARPLGLARSPERRARSESPYRLSYHAPHSSACVYIYTHIHTVECFLFKQMTITQRLAATSQNCN